MAHTDSYHLGGFLAVVAASLLWGTTGTAASFSPDVSPLAIGAFSMGLGGVLLALNACQQIHREYALLKQHFVLCIMGGLSVAVYPLAFYTSMRWSGVAIGTVVSIASAPFFSVLLERLLNQKSISPKWWKSAGFGTLGIVLLTFSRIDQPEHLLNLVLQQWGIVLGLVAGLTYATYSWTAKQLITVGIGSRTAMASMFGLAATVLMPSLLFTSQHMFSTSLNLSVALYIALIPMFVGYKLFGYALNHIEASQATLITLLEPAIAAILAVVIVGEKFSWFGWVGMLSIAVCLWLQTRSSGVKKALP